MKTRKIVIEYIKPPVPSNKYDWMAYRDDYDFVYNALMKQLY